MIDLEGITYDWSDVVGGGWEERRVSDGGGLHDSVNRSGDEVLRHVCDWVNKHANCREVVVIQFNLRYRSVDVDVDGLMERMKGRRRGEEAEW